MVFQEVQTDLENQGYEVQAYILPACGKNAPHKRERTFFVAHSKLHKNKYSNNGGSKQEEGNIRRENKGNVSNTYNSNEIITNSKDIGQKYALENRELERRRFRQSYQRNAWNSFPSQSPICGGDDGIPKELDFITFSKWRNESLKAYGNAVVPQIAYEIFKAIQSFEDMVNV